jgi:hypothetical protein
MKEREREKRKQQSLTMVFFEATLCLVICIYKLFSTNASAVDVSTNNEQTVRFPHLVFSSVPTVYVNNNIVLICISLISEVQYNC